MLAATSDFSNLPTEHYQLECDIIPSSDVWLNGIHYKCAEALWSLQDFYSVYFSRNPSLPIQSKWELLHIVMLYENTTPSIALIHKLEQWFAGGAVLCFAHQLASCLTHLIICIWRVTVDQGAGFNKQQTHLAASGCRAFAFKKKQKTQIFSAPFFSFYYPFWSWDP